MPLLALRLRIIMEKRLTKGSVSVSDRKDKVCNPRRGKTGGEALIEGVMMKSAKRYAVSVRKEDGFIGACLPACRFWQ